MDTQSPNQDPEQKKPRVQPKSGNKKLIAIIAVVVVAIAATGLWFSRQPAQPPSGPATPADKHTAGKVKNQPVIEYQQAEQNELMAQRKAALGIKEGVDLIVKEDESIRVGDQTVSMQEIRDSIQAREGGITEKDLTAVNDSQPGAYGIYVVQPGDNIWNIHYNLLKAYMAGKEITLPESSDEPDHAGYSSGIGKLLKFSENMVYIYNLKDRQLTTDINMIRPLTKIVIYRMDRVFELLDQVDVRDAGRIRFDGENIWIPAE
jgi:hypothetical protein